MKIIYSFAALILFSINTTFAANGDTVKVVTHQNVVMTTDPGGSGSNENKQWAVFPAAGTNYRKAFVVMSYKCPTGMACGEWDYIDQVLLRRVGGVNGDDKAIELIRFITPYGNGLNSSWSFGWHSDVTDFAMYLHDSVEIGYVHTGYETSVGKGWDVTLEFNMVEGPWVMEPVKITPLWNGSWGFGNDADPIENHLTPIDHTFDANAQNGRVRIHHTGHGFDANDGCSEFCNRYRQLKWDNALVDQEQLWRKCGFNALYPQGGTWVYDRGNWCPGAVVYPRVVDNAAAGGSTHNINIDMEVYTDDAPSGNEYIRSYLIETKSPTLQNDVRVDDIFRPNNFKEYSRINPICDNPLIQVANLGTNPVTSMQINCGYSGQSTFTYNWNGTLQPGTVDTIEIAQTFVIPTVADHLFTVNIASVNGVADSYPLDNISSTRSSATVVTDSAIYLELKTNNEPAENSYTLTDTWGNVYYNRPFNSMTANTTYRDTFYLPTNTCYRLVIQDEALGGGNGLTWWANSAGGSGTARLRKAAGGALIKTFLSDFGSRIEFNFTVGSVVSSIEEIPGAFEVTLSPNPTADRAVIDYMSPKVGDWQVDVFDVLGQRVYTHALSKSLGEMLTLDMSEQPSGFYIVRVTQDGQSVARRLMVTR